jgi:addiction module RelE/StbE family toxin
MVQVKWTHEAMDDVDGIAEYISRDSSYYAQFFIEKIICSTDKLAVFPNSGRVLPELNRDDIREIIVGNYRIIYHIAHDFVAILSVYHSSRLLDPSDIKTSS